MEILGIVGIVLGILAIIYFSVKGLNTIVGAPLAGLLVILFNSMPIMESFLSPQNSYMASLANFVIANFAIFMLGSVLAKYMEKSGATVSIADKILSLIGTEKPYNIMVAIFIIAALLTYGGVSMFVVCFALIPMAKPLFKQMNLKWNLVTIPVFAGMATFTLSMLPGTPAASNYIPSNALGTPLTAAPAIGIVTSLIVIIYLLFYMKVALKKSLARGERWVEGEAGTMATAIDKDKLPAFGVSILPIISLVGIILIFRNVQSIIVVALIAAILIAAVVFRNQIDSQYGILNEGAAGSLGTTMTTGSTIAFGSLLTLAPAFGVIRDSIINIPSNPLVSYSIATVLLSSITGSSVGAVGIAMETFAPTYIALGVAPELLHRVGSIAAGAFGVLPHTGLVITFNSITNLDLKSSYKYQFMTVSVSHFIALVISLIMASTMY